MNTQVVEFNNHNIELINHKGQKYMTARQIAEVLEYSDRNKVSNLYNAHKDEFEGKSLVLDLGTRGNPSERARVFNREGAWLIGMFARTPKAAEFRKWVLKVLGAVADNRLPTAQIDTKVIGGAVKRGVTAAIKQELTAIFNNPSMPDLIKTYEPLSDEDMLRCLRNWYFYHHYKAVKEQQRLFEENAQLRSKLDTIRKTAVAA